MIKPYFDKIDRMIIKNDNSFSASRMKLFIAQKKLEKEIAKPLDKIIEFLAKYIN